MATPFIGTAATIIFTLATAGSVWAGGNSPLVLANQQTEAGGAAAAGENTVMTPEGTFDCPPGSTEAICQQGAPETERAGEAANATEPGMVEPEEADMAMDAEGFEGAVVSDAEGKVVGTVVQAVAGSNGDKPERFIIRLDEGDKRVAVDASETEIGDNTVTLTGHTMADLAAMEAYEGGEQDATAEAEGGSTPPQDQSKQ